jgi:hypothetical protein
MMIDRMERNSGIVTKFVDEERFKKEASEYVTLQIFDEVKRGSA